MKYWILVILAIALLGCSSPATEEPEKMQAEPEKNTITLPEGEFDLAPELTNEVWLNTEEPLRLAGLRGKVVLLEMWTFG